MTSGAGTAAAGVPLFTAEERRERWQLEMSAKSLKKRSKLAVLLPFIGRTDGLRCLEIGCDRGVTSYYLRKLGGCWVSVDPEDVNTRATRALVGDGVAQIDYTRLGFRSASMDRVVAIDCLEHIEAHERLMSEIARTLKDDGTAIISAPMTGPLHVLHRLGSALGLKPSFYGHVREGYTEEELRKLAEGAGLRVIDRTSCTRFLTELIELIVNTAYLFVLNRRGQAGIAPADESSLRKHGFAFRLFSVAFPLLRLISSLDHLFFWSRGYIIILRAVKARSLR